MSQPKIFKMSFASVYPLYIQKVERKGRSKAEVDEIIFWLTGYDEETLQQIIENKVDFEMFFEEAPHLNENVSLIKGVICGYRVEDIEDPLMQKIRYLDKLIDELAKGKKWKRSLGSKWQSSKRNISLTILETSTTLEFVFVFYYVPNLKRYFHNFWFNQKSLPKLNYHFCFCKVV